MIKKFFTLIFLISLALKVTGQDVPQLPSSTSMDSLKTSVSKLMKYYDSYENGSPESLKKANYNDAIDEISGGTATQKDKDDAYKIIDAYIKADVGTSNNSTTDDTPDSSDSEANTDLGIDQEEVQEMLHDTQQQSAQAQEMADEAINKFMNMSYAEYESYMLVINPFLCKKEIQESYNEIHKNDGKKVVVTAKCEESETQKQLKAFNILQNPQDHTYSEFKSAILFLNPNTPESEIREAWDKSK